MGYPTFGSALSETSGASRLPLLYRFWTPGTLNWLCQEGIGKVRLSPPVEAPPLHPVCGASFQTVSLALEPFQVRVVPPTLVTKGCSPGSPGSRVVVLYLSK